MSSSETKTAELIRNLPKSSGEAPAVSRAATYTAQGNNLAVLRRVSRKLIAQRSHALDLRAIGAGADGLTAQFFRDLLSGGIEAVEKCNGSVISFTGDGFQAVLPTEKDAACACWHIAKDFRRPREYLSDTCDDGTPAWPQMEIGVGLKIALERGVLEISTITLTFLGQQPFLVGEPTIYASRMLAFGEGDRCVVGPKAAANWECGGLDGPYEGREARGLDLCVLLL